MTLNELRKTKEELINKKEELIKIFNKEIDNAVRCQNNQFDTTITMRMIFSALPYIVIITIMAITRGILVRIGNADILLNIPKLLVLPATIIPSAIIGTLIDKKLTKKKRTNEFANMSEEEKVEMQVRHEIEATKAHNKAEVISQTLHEINEKEKFISTNSEFYGVQTHNINSEETNKKIENISNKLKKKIEILDILTTKAVIAEEFTEERLTGYDTQKLIVSSFGYGLIGTMYTLIPFMVLGLYFNGLNSLLTLLAIYGTNAAIFGGYCDYRTKLKRRVFKKLNDELGDDALAETSEYVINEKSGIKRAKEKIIDEASFLLGLLQEEKSILSHSNENNNELSDSKENNYNIENYISNNESYDDTKYKKIEGPTLVKRK